MAGHLSQAVDTTIFVGLKGLSKEIVTESGTNLIWYHFVPNPGGWPRLRMGQIHSDCLPCCKGLSPNGSLL